MTSRCKGSLKFPPQMPPAQHPPPELSPPAAQQAADLWDGSPPGWWSRVASRAGTPQSTGSCAPAGAELVYATDCEQLFGSAPREDVFGPRPLAPEHGGRTILRCNAVRHRRLSQSPERPVAQHRSLLTEALSSNAVTGAKSPVQVAPALRGGRNSFDGQAERRVSQPGSRSTSLQRPDIKRPASSQATVTCTWTEAPPFFAGSPGAEPCVPTDGSLLERYRVEL